MQRRGRLQRQNSAQDMYGGKPKPGPSSFPVLSVTRDQRALLNRFGLRGVAAHNEPVIRQYYAAERPGTNAYRAVRLSRAIASRRFQTSIRGDRRSQAKARAIELAGAQQQPPTKRGWFGVGRRSPPSVLVNKAARLTKQQVARRQNRFGKIAYNQKHSGKDAFRATRRAGTAASNRDRLRQLVGMVWNAGRMVSQVMKPPESLEQRLYHILRVQGTPLAIEAMLRTTKRQTQAATAADTLAKAVTSFATKSALCSIGLGRLLTASTPVGLAIGIAASHLGTKAYIAIENKWNDIVNRILEGSANKSITRVGGLLGRLLEAANKMNVPECVQSLFVSGVFRGFVNDLLRKYAGVELDYVVLTNVLVKHGTKVRQFMEGEPVKLRPLVLDMVQALPDSQIDVAIATISAKYAGLTKAPVW